MYPAYMNPYANSQYPYHPMPPQFPQAGAMQNGYVPYPQHYGRSPPGMQQPYAHMMGEAQPPTYSRPPPQSPVVVSSPSHMPPSQHPQVVYSNPYQPPLPAPSTVAAPVAPIPPPVLPPTPSSTLSSQAPPPMSPAVSVAREPAPQPILVQLPESKPTLPTEAFRPPLPWYSHPNESFPQRAAKSRRRRRILAADAEGVKLPQPPHELNLEVQQSESDVLDDTQTPVVATSRLAEDHPSASPALPLEADVPAGERPHTPMSHKDASERGILTPTSSASANALSKSPTVTSPSMAKAAKPASRAPVPAVPILPIIPKVAGKEAKSAPAAEKGDLETQHPSEHPVASDAKTAPASAETQGDAAPSEDAAADAKAPAHPVSTGPKVWASLFSRPSASAVASTHSGVNGAATADTAARDGATGASNFSKSNMSSLGEALRAYRVGSGEKVAFIEPRGLTNSGNMCYMNSVLQVLVFCVPFWDFLDQASKKAAHSFTSETPLIDAMIMFLHEFKVIDSAVSVDQLKKRLKNEELEQYGEPFTPTFVYEAIKKVPRFSSMRGGHQQDAEEFLGFLLESLNDECAKVMRSAPALPSGQGSTDSTTATSHDRSHSTDVSESTNGWFEVGHRQRAAVTRSSGHASSLSPVTKIFGGQLRSEFRVPGLKDSVTLEPYQSLPLDIGHPQVRNIVDALRGLTKPESLHGDFNSPRGKDVTATKQVFIESLPPTLILHLKRFQFDGEGFGTVKIWKKVGYPLELEIPREVFSRQKRNTVAAEGLGLPKYKLMAVVYHHGKHANGGHYTVDIRRQDGREWIRLDDTVIRRIRSEDVAEGGAEEDPIKNQDSNRADTSAASSGSTNRFAGMGDDDAGESENGEWKQVTAPSAGGKKWSSVVNGAAPPQATAQAKQFKESLKDNKVAYMLFYQRI